MRNEIFPSGRQRPTGRTLNPTTIFRLGSMVETVGRSADLGALHETLEGIAALLEDVPPHLFPRTTLDGWASRILRTLARAIRADAGHVAGPFLVDAYRSLPTIDGRVEFLDEFVWPSAVSRAAKLGLYRYVASASRSNRVREWLAEKEDPRRDEEVKAVLLRSEAEAVLSHLLPDPRAVPDESFPRLLERLARRHPGAAATALIRRVSAPRPESHVVGGDGDGRRAARGTVRVRAETLTRLLDAGPYTREATMELLPRIEVVS